MDDGTAHNLTVEAMVIEENITYIELEFTLCKLKGMTPGIELHVP